MSLIKWTLAMAGAAMGVRYMSERHRRRIAEEGTKDKARDERDNKEADRESDRVWPTAMGGGVESGDGNARRDDSVRSGGVLLGGNPTSRP